MSSFCQAPALTNPLQHTLVLNLMCAAEKTNYRTWIVYWRCMSLNYTLDGLIRNKRLVWVTYCMLYQEQTQTNQNTGHIRNNPSCLGSQMSSLLQHVRAQIKTFPGGYDELEFHWTSPSLPSPTYQTQHQGEEVRLRSNHTGHTRNPASETVACWWASSQTENSDPARWPRVNSNSRRRRRPVNGLHHSREGGLPNTAFIPSHLMWRSHVGFSFLRRSISCKTLTQF